MAYTQVSDVRNAAPQIEVTAATKPSEGQVVGMITDVEREMNASLGHLGYDTPVTGTESVKICRDMVVHAVIAKILRARAFGQADPNEKGAGSAQKHYDDRLKWLGDPRHPFELPDADRTDEATEKDASGQLLSAVDGISEDFEDADLEITRRQVF